MPPLAIGIPVVVVLILIFIVIGFPWDSLARRIAWEISAASGSRVSIDDLAPALTARGPVLRARDVVIEHLAIDRVRLDEFEVAPRFGMSWFRGEPTLRIWANSVLGGVDGVLQLGESSAFVGRVTRVELARMPLRLDASAVRIGGQLDAEADMMLSPNGTLHGRIAFSSPSLRFETSQLPVPIPFTHAEGVIEILETGATRIESVSLEGPALKGEIEGEIGLVHHSQSPPIDVNARIRLIDPRLQELAETAGLRLSSNGTTALHIRGTVDDPEFEVAATRDGSAAERARARRGQRAE
jgi:type II secretion system protein N